MAARNPLPSRATFPQKPLELQSSHSQSAYHPLANEKITTASNKLSAFGRIFKFKNANAYLIVGSIFLANGIAHSIFLYNYWKNPEETKRWLAEIPVKMEKYLKSSK